MPTLAISTDEAAAALSSPDPMGLGLAADALSRSLLSNQAGYHAPRHVRLTVNGTVPWGAATSELDNGHVRIAGLDPTIDASMACRQIEALAHGGAWVEGLQTHDLARLGEGALARLRSAGLQRVLGSHVETFVAGARRWSGEHDWSSSLSWLSRAAAAGLRVQPSIWYGQDETAAELAARLGDVRALQERTGRVDGVSLVPHHDRKERETPGEISFGLEDMRLVAVTRLMLDNVRHVEISWLAFGFKAGTMALAFGADDLGPWCVDRAVTEAAHLASYLAVREEEIVSAIEACGRIAQRWKGNE